MGRGKSREPVPKKNTPRHSEHNAKGTLQNPFGKGSPKEELLARMKAAAEAGRKV
ncbi:hypothetical protein LAZ40_00380 [Cereibacter sphaeroides]|uniref:hypothetical protein n=1 Tax=Cereibacter sphaeroides TaxID=1063 RepID=UPI001F1F985F|nr:hypothetical protein [Cereibacter sphaeroides]MCE6957545.1 hypothetical protein [Cereibacter sphaeroides]MCE6971096.1 hypothetical protein [Cereibacter sphaeroides]